MKRAEKYFLSICICVLLIIGAVFSPTTTVLADESTTQTLSTIYPEGISHYLNLNDVNDFCVVGDDIFFVAKGKQISDSIDYLYYFIRYNFVTNEKQVIIDGTDSTIPNQLRSFRDMQYANGAILLKYENSYTAYDTNTYERFSIRKLSEFGTDTTHFTFANFGDSKTICANIYQRESKYYLGVAVYDNREDLKEGTCTFGEFDLSTISIEQSDIDKLVVFGHSAYIIAGSDVYPFTITSSTTSVSLSCNPKKTVAKFGDMCSIRAFEFEDNTYLAMSTQNDISLFDKDINNTTFTANLDKSDDKNIIYVLGNKLYFYNSDDCNIETYSITKSQDKLALSTAHTTFLMGKGSGIGRFDGVGDITMKCNQYVFVADNLNNRIQVIYKNKTIKSIDLKEGSTKYYATSLMLASDNTLYFVRTDTIQTALCKVNIFTSSTPTISKVTDLSNSIKTATITDGNKIYLLDNSTNIVKVYDTVADTFNSNIDLSFTTNANSKIAYMDRFLYITVDKKLYKLNVANTSMKYDYTFSQDIADISIPTSDQSVYVSFSDQNHIERYSFESGVLTDALTSVDFDEEYKINVFSVNPQDGTIYAFDENASRIVYFDNNEFTKGYDNAESFQDGATTNMFGFTSILNYVKIPAHTFIYEYVNYKGDHNLYSEDKYAILLPTDKSTAVFSYVLYVDGDLVKLGYVETNAIQAYSVSTAQNYSLITSNYNTPIYKFPTIKGGYIVNSIENISTVITAVASYPVAIDNTNNTYYVILMNDGRYGFVSSAYVTSNENISQKFSTNSTIKIYDYSDFVNVYSDKDKTTIIGALSNDQRVYVEKLDKHEELTLIKYLDGDNNIRVGYIDTKYITTDGTSPVITTAIILFAINFVIIIALLTWFIIFKQKQKKDALNEQTKKLESDNQTPDKSDIKSTKKQNKTKIKDSTINDSNTDNADNK